MENRCPKCGGEMDKGRVANRLLHGYKSDKQQHFSREANVSKAKACLECGFLEFYIDAAELKAKRTQS